MICEKILGKISDSAFAGKTVDYVDFEWHETYSKLHRKKSRGGRDVAISLDDSILKIGIKPGDVLGVSEEVAFVADVTETEVLSVKIGDPLFASASKAAYEIGNCHAPLFMGKNEHELITIYNEPMERLLKNLGESGYPLTVEKKIEKLDFSKQVSSIVGHSHHHEH